MAPTLSLKGKKNLYGTKENTTMDMKLFWIFVVLNIVNVIIQTVKSLATVKCGKTLAAIANAVAYGLYTVVVVYMVCDLPLWLKVVVVGACNLVGVFFVKWGEEKATKDKLWKIEFTINSLYNSEVDIWLDRINIPHSYNRLSEKHTIFSCYCSTQQDSGKVKEIVKHYNAKYFITENKSLL